MNEAALEVDVLWRISCVSLLATAGKMGWGESFGASVYSIPFSLEEVSLLKGVGTASLNFSFP